MRRLVEKLIPNLRRYGRLMIGMDEAADRILFTLLRSTVLPRTDDAVQLRLDLFRLYSAALSSEEPQAPQVHYISVSPPKTPETLLAAVLRLPPMERAILCLVCVEEFSVEESAEILGLPRSLLEVALATAVVKVGPEE